MANDQLQPDDPAEGLPEPHTEVPELAPGGPDAVPSDVTTPPLLIPEPPFSAQLDDLDIPEEIEEPEQMDEAVGDNVDMPAGTEPPV